MRVVYVPLDMSTAERATWQWLGIQPDIATVRANPDEAARMARLSRADVIWIDAAVPLAVVPPGIMALADEANGPGWLLTNGAVMLPHRLGIESVAPNDVIDRPWRDADDELFLFDDFAETTHLRGHAAFRRHPLFDGLGGGAFTWRPREDELYRAVTCRRPDWPANARVIAVERAFIHINEQRATIWAYESPRRILCIGAHLPFAPSDRVFARIVERLTRNALAWPSLASDVLATALHWTLSDAATRPVAGDGDPCHATDAHGAATIPSPASGHAVSPLPLDLASLRLATHAGEPFTLAGRRAMMAGHAEGSCELWIHPLRVMQIGDDPDLTQVRAIVSPLGIEQRIATAAGVVVERIVVLHDQPAAVFEWDRGPVSLAWRTDLRLMWPYNAGALGSLEWSASPRSLLVHAPATGESVCFEVSEEVVWSIRDAPEGGAAGLRCAFSSASMSPFRLTVMASVLGDRPLESIQVAIGDPADHVRARAAALRRIGQDRLRADVPDPEVGTAIEWAKARLDGYLVETPGVGTSLVAGYWTSRPGWNDGRPGYAWYFGRDAVWTAFASLACGDFDAVRDVIEFLGNHQDVSGKILHECTTSGSVHYDAADSTPLYLLLVARHQAWTGDATFMRSQLTRVRAALDFCLSTDTDGDGLIENTRVGHGWIEFGRLGGGKVTYYNAGVWAAALRELVTAFEDIGEVELGRATREHARIARTSLERLFFSTARQAYALKAWNPEPGDDPDIETVHLAGFDWARDFTATATHAVPLLLGMADAERAKSWLDRVASPDFSAEWGVRMIARDEPGFDPASYHGGAVWPLYTGWVAWAEYAAGRSDAAFGHWRANIGLAFEGESGAWDEVLHGAERRGIGVCPDQAWSTAMAISPFVHGLLGAEPDATRGRLRLRPQIPSQWDRLEVRNLRMGDATISCRYHLAGQTHAFTLEQDEGAVPVRILFEPAIPVRAIAAVRIDGIEARLDLRPFGERMLAPVQLVLDHARTIEIDGDP